MCHAINFSGSISKLKHPPSAFLWPVFPGIFYSLLRCRQPAGRPDCLGWQTTAMCGGRSTVISRKRPSLFTTWRAAKVDVGLLANLVYLRTKTAIKSEKQSAGYNGIGEHRVILFDLEPKKISTIPSMYWSQQCLLLLTLIMLYIVYV